MGQVAEPMQQESDAFADVQLLPTALPHSCDDSAVSNLQQYGSYMVLDQPPDSVSDPAMQQTYINTDQADAASAALNSSAKQSHNAHAVAAHAAAAPLHSLGGNQGASTGSAAAMWYGELDGEAAANAALNSQGPAGSSAGHEAGYGQSLVHYTAVAKKGFLGDVYRHDTPTSVLDIFSALSMVPGSPRVPFGILSSGKLLLLV